MVKYYKLDRGHDYSTKRDYSTKLRALCSEFNVGKTYPRLLQMRVEKGGSTPLPYRPAHQAPHH